MIATTHREDGGSEVILACLQEWVDEEFAELIASLCDEGSSGVGAGAGRRCGLTGDPDGDWRGTRSCCAGTGPEQHGAGRVEFATAADGRVRSPPGPSPVRVPAATAQ